MENLRNRINVKLVNKEKDYLKCTSKPKSQKRRTKDFAIIYSRHVKANLH